MGEFREVTQTRTGIPAGNCTEACIASLLGIDIEEVPQLWCGRLDATEEEAQPPERAKAMDEWLAARGLERIEWKLSDPSPLPLPEAFFDGIQHWPGDAPHMLVGPNPDGVCHMVIGQGGAILWDPNPLRRGILSVTHVAVLAPLGSLAQWSGEGEREVTR